MAVDVHRTHPPGCIPCASFPEDRACLEHTCPDCGSISWNEKNARGELVHQCPTPGHELKEIADFTPLPGPTYFRFYCSCGAVGGKRSTASAARTAYDAHVRMALG